MFEFTSLLGVLDSVSLEVGREDFRVLLGDSSGSFSDSSFFESFFPITEYHYFPYFHNIWRLPIPVKVQVFSWTVTLGKLQTCDSLQRRWPNCALSPNWCEFVEMKRGSRSFIIALSFHIRFMEQGFAGIEVRVDLSKKGA